MSIPMDNKLIMFSHVVYSIDGECIARVYNNLACTRC
jgi:hypothetical protein